MRDSRTDDGTGDLSKDLAWLLFNSVIAALALVILQINPKAKSDDESGQRPGMMVELSWPDGRSDVDLWVQAPNDVPVGYSNKGGEVFNLLRDDLGITKDILPINYENSVSRGVPAGEYTVNVHLYKNQSGQTEIPCSLQVSIKRSPTDGMAVVLRSDVTLTKEGQELTAMRFRVGENGEIVPGSVTKLFRPLRAY